MSIALGNRDEDSITSLAGRLARLDRQLSDDDKKEIEKETDGKPVKQIINELLDAVDPDKQFGKEQEMFKTDDPKEEEIKQESEELAKGACKIFDNPKVRNTLIEIKRRNEQIIDTVSKDTVIFMGFDEQAKEKALTLVDTFKTFIKENKDEITALQIIYSKSYGKRHLTYEAIKQLADAIKKPPYQLTPDLLWQAFEQLEKSKVRRAGPQKLLTDIISLVRFAIGKSEVLEPFTETVNDRFELWLSLQEKSGRIFTPEQIEWLKMIKDHITASLRIEMDDFELAPFYEKGGAIKAYQIFGQELDNVLEELNEALVI